LPILQQKTELHFAPLRSLRQMSCQIQTKSINIPWIRSLETTS
jgi:hypothetical protein